MEGLAGTLFYRSESDVCRLQILTSKVNPRTVRIYIFHIGKLTHKILYVLKLSKKNSDIYDDFKLKKTLGLIVSNYLSALKVEDVYPGCEDKDCVFRTHTDPYAYTVMYICKTLCLPSVHRRGDI